MATKKELFEAVRTLKEHCKKCLCASASCPLDGWCTYVVSQMNSLAPADWPDPEEGGSKDGRFYKTGKCN